MDLARVDSSRQGWAHRKIWFSRRNIIWVFVQPQQVTWLAQYACKQTIAWSWRILLCEMTPSRNMTRNRCILIAYNTPIKYIWCIATFQNHCMFLPNMFSRNSFVFTWKHALGIKSSPVVMSNQQLGQMKHRKVYSISHHLQFNYLNKLINLIYYIASQLSHLTFFLPSHNFTTWRWTTDTSLQPLGPELKRVARGYQVVAEHGCPNPIYPPPHPQKKSWDIWSMLLRRGRGFLPDTAQPLEHQPKSSQKSA